MLLLCLRFRTTVVAAAAFLDAFQKVADMATNTRGKQIVGGAQREPIRRMRSFFPLGGFASRDSLSYQSLADSWVSHPGTFLGKLQIALPTVKPVRRMDTKGKEPQFMQEVASCVVLITFNDLLVAEP